MRKTNGTIVLLVLDGWGCLPPSPYNAISLAKTPCWDACWKHDPHVLLEASGTEVGLPEGQMGNSEVGHLTMGAGRVVDQDLTRIHKAIRAGSFAEHPLLLAAFATAKAQNRAIHLMGLLSPGGVHSHESHLYALLDAAKQQHCNQVFVHPILDGRDTPPRSAESSLSSLTHLCKKTGAQIATVVGRYYAMDRDKRSERTEQAYQLIAQGEAPYHATSAISALQMAYKRGESDEFVKPTLIEHHPIKAGDVVICFNFRADRMRQLCAALREKAEPIQLLTFTEYTPDLKAEILFPNPPLTHMLGAYLADLGCSQLRLAETEKYAHVTFFFNGGLEKTFKNEERILIPSDKVATYDLAPKMQVEAITDALIKAIQSKEFDFVLCNFANADMVGHTGNLKATIEAIEAIDKALARLVEAIKHDNTAQLLITADHGNAECLFDDINDQPHTAHTTSKVPLLYVGKKGVAATQKEGTLKDIAPTILQLMGLPIPPEMMGKGLLQ